MLNGQSSHWLDITATGSVLGTFLFLFKFNDLYFSMTLTLYYF